MPAYVLVLEEARRALTLSLALLLVPAMAPPPSAAVLAHQNSQPQQAPPPQQTPPAQQPPAGGQPPAPLTQEQLDALHKKIRELYEAKAKELGGAQTIDGLAYDTATIAKMIVIRDVYVMQLKQFISQLSAWSTASTAQKDEHIKKLVEAALWIQQAKLIIAVWEAGGRAGPGGYYVLQSAIANLEKAGYTDIANWMRICMSSPDGIRMAKEKITQLMDQEPLLGVTESGLFGDSLQSALVNAVGYEGTEKPTPEHLRGIYDKFIQVAVEQTHEEINRVNGFTTAEQFIEFFKPQYAGARAFAGNLYSGPNGPAQFEGLARDYIGFTEAEAEQTKLTIAIIVSGIAVFAIVVAPVAGLAATAVGAGTETVATTTAVASAIGSGANLGAMGVQLVWDGKEWVAVSEELANAEKAAAVLGQANVEALREKQQSATTHLALDVIFVGISAKDFRGAVQKAELTRAAGESAAVARAAAATAKADAAAAWAIAKEQVPALQRLEQFAATRTGRIIDQLVDDVMSLKADPAAMRSLKNAPEDVRLLFNDIEGFVYRAHDTAVVRHVESIKTLKDGRPAPWAGRELEVQEFRTPGSGPGSVNTDRDYRLVYRDPERGWIEVPKEYWSEFSTQRFAQVSGYTPEKLRQIASPQDIEAWRTWNPAEHRGETLEQAMQAKWQELHQQLATDKYHPEASVDFSDQVRQAGITSQAEKPNIMNVKAGEAMLQDAERLGMMYNEKAEAYFRLRSALHPGGDKLEGMAQLNKGIGMLEDVRVGYQKLFAAAGQKAPIGQLSDRFRQAEEAVRSLAPFDKTITEAQIAQVENRLRDLGFNASNPLADFKTAIDSQFTALKTVPPPSSAWSAQPALGAAETAAATSSALNEPQTSCPEVEDKCEREAEAYYEAVDAYRQAKVEFDSATEPAAKSAAGAKLAAAEKNVEEARLRLQHCEEQAWRECQQKVAGTPSTTAPATSAQTTTAPAPGPQTPAVSPASGAPGAQPAGAGAAGAGTTPSPTPVGAVQQPCPTQTDCDKLCAEADRLELEAAAAADALQVAEANREKAYAKAKEADKDAEMQKYNRDNRISVNLEIAAQRRAYAKKLREDADAAVAKAKTEAEAKAQAAAAARAACEACRPCPEQTKTAAKTGADATPTQPDQTAVGQPPSGANAASGAPVPVGSATVGDVSGSGTPQVIIGAVPGSPPQVQVLNGTTGQQLSNFLAYPPSFIGGVHVAVGDLNGDGKLDIVTGPGSGGTPQVKVFNATGQEFNSFFAYNPSFTGGVKVAVGDLNGDGNAEIITGPGPGGAPQVKVFNGTGQELNSFFPFNQSFPGGVNVAAGDLNGDRNAEIITGPGPGGAPQVKVFNGTGQESNSFFAFNQSFAGGVNVAVGDANGDGKPDVITSTGQGSTPQLRAFNGMSGEEYKSEFLGGIEFEVARSVSLGVRYVHSRPPADGANTAPLPIIGGAYRGNPGVDLKEDYFTGETDEGAAYTGGVLDNAMEVGIRSILEKPATGEKPSDSTLFSPSFTGLRFGFTFDGGGSGTTPTTDPEKQSIFTYIDKVETVVSSTLPHPSQSRKDHGVARSASRKQVTHPHRSQPALQLVAYRSRTVPPSRFQAASAPQSAPPSKPTPTTQPAPMQFSIVSNGKTGDEALQLQVFDPSGKVKQIRLRPGVVLEPLKQTGTAPKPFAERHAGAAAGKLLTQQMAALCLDFIKLPPEAGTLYRIAPRAVQEKFKPLRSILEAGHKLANEGKLHPDSEPKAYATFIRQFALWTKLEKWDLKKFTEMFIQHSKKSAEVQKFQWTKEVENELLAAAPGRWRDITAVLSEAEAISKASVTKSSD